MQAFYLGTIAYRPAWELQNRLADEVAAGKRPPALLLLEHPHVYTFGRQGKQQNLLWGPEELARRGIEVVWSDRGGDVTYHGPGQLVGYPILSLAGEKAKDPARWNTVGYLRKLEETLVALLADHDIPARVLPGQTGVWVFEEGQPPAKIASIGVRVDARGITRHGFALNVDPQMDYWEGIVACGLENQRKSSMAAWLGSPPSLEEMAHTAARRFGGVFGVEVEFAEVGALEIPAS